MYQNVQNCNSQVQKTTQEQIHKTKNSGKHRKQMHFTTTELTDVAEYKTSSPQNGRQ